MISQLNTAKHPTAIVSERTQNSSVNKRISWVDHARGIAIMLVTYRHIVVGLRRSGFIINDALYNVQEIFYNFRMPVFFVLSGLFVANSLKKKSSASVLKDRASTILYPYLLWAVILVSLEMIFQKYTNSNRSPRDYINIIVQPRGIDHLWYLFALFNTTLLYLGTRKIITEKWIQLAFGFLLHSLTFLPFLQKNSLVSDAFYFLPYFILGSFLEPVLLNQNKNKSFLNPGRLKWLFPVFVLGQVFWFLHRFSEKTWFILFFAIDLLACYFLYIIANYISKKKWTCWLAYLGRHSLYIYILHVPVAAMIRILFIHFNVSNNPIIILVSCWVVGLCVPVWLYRSLKEFGVDRLFSLKAKSAR